RGHEDAGDIRGRFAHGFANSVEDGNLLRVEVNGFTAAARRDAADELRPVLETLLGVEFARGAGDALDNQPRVLVDQDAHGRTVACFSCTMAISPPMRKLEFFHW